MVPLDNIHFDLMSLDQIPIVREGNTHEEIDPIDEVEEGKNPLDQYKVSANESALIPTIPCEASEEIITMAPGKGVTPIYILTDKHCEELAHPHLFPAPRKVALSLVQYFNQRLSVVHTCENKIFSQTFSQEYICENKSVRIYQFFLIYSHERSHRKIARINPVRINCTVHTCENKIYSCEKVCENNFFSQV